MLILDYERWKHRDIPILFYQFEDEASPCILTQCVITPTCSKECNKFMDFLYVRVSETIAYLRDQMGMDYYKYVETAPTYNAEALTKVLLSMYNDKSYPTNKEELNVIMKRYFYCMKTANGICSRRKARHGGKPGDFYISM